MSASCWLVPACFTIIAPVLLSQFGGDLLPCSCHCRLLTDGPSRSGVNATPWWLAVLNCCLFQKLMSVNCFAYVPD
jgi:hypothetical protein